MGFDGLAAGVIGAAPCTSRRFGLESEVIGAVGLGCKAQTTSPFGLKTWGTKCAATQKVGGHQVPQRAPRPERE